MNNEFSNKQIKVCHVTSVHSRYDVRIYHKECKSLAQNGYDVTLVVNDTFKNEIIDDIKIISTQFKPKNRIDRFIKSKKKLERIMLDVDADIYHLHDPELLMLVKKIKKKNRKIIFDSHEHYATQIREKLYIPRVIRGITSQIYRFVENRVFSLVDSIIFPCTIDGKYPFEKYSKKTVLIDNFPSMREFYDNYKSDVEKDDSVCYAGGLNHSRGTTHAIIASYEAGVKLKLAGKFSSFAYHEELKNMKEYSNVQYIGYLDRDQIVELYSKSNIGLCALLDVGQYNKTDNLPTKAYEYMSMGLPVILSDSVYARKILEQYNFGVLVNPQDTKDISNAISCLINNSKIANDMGDEGRSAVREKYNWESQEKKLVELYKKLMS